MGTWVTGQSPHGGIVPSPRTPQAFAQMAPRAKKETPAPPHASQRRGSAGPRQRWKASTAKAGGRRDGSVTPPWAAQDPAAPEPAKTSWSGDPKRHTCLPGHHPAALSTESARRKTDSSALCPLWPPRPTSRSTEAVTELGDLDVAQVPCPAPAWWRGGAVLSRLLL